MNVDAITIQDCIDNYEFKDMAVVINDGHIVMFKKENPHTDR